MINNIVKNLYELMVEEDLDSFKTDLVEETSRFDRIYKKLNAEQLRRAAIKILSDNGAQDGFVLITKNEALEYLPAKEKINSVINKHILDIDTGELTSKTNKNNGLRCVEAVAEVIIEAIYRTKNHNTKEAEEAEYQEDNAGRDQYSEYNFQFYNYDEYLQNFMPMVRKLEDEIVNARIEINDEKRADNVQASREETQKTVEKEFTTWLQSDVASYVLKWYYHSITDISAVVPSDSKERKAFDRHWSFLLRSAGIDPMQVRSAQAGRWGFSIIARISKSSFEKLKKEAQTNDIAKAVYEEITTATTIKRKENSSKNLEKIEWERRPVLNDAGSSLQLTGNNWVIDLIRKLNDMAETSQGGNKFTIGANKNFNKDFSITEEYNQEE